MGLMINPSGDGFALFAWSVAMVGLALSFLVIALFLRI
jgi:hypothetical protein